MILLSNSFALQGLKYLCVFQGTKAMRVHTLPEAAAAITYKLNQMVAELSASQYRHDSEASIPQTKHCQFDLPSSFERPDLMSKLQKIVVSVELPCSKCRLNVMKLVAAIEGITSIALDTSKNTVTVIGEADPEKIIKKVRKFRKCADIVSVGPSKEDKKPDKKPEQKSSPQKPKTCQGCVVRYEVAEDGYYNYCSIL